MVLYSYPDIRISGFIVKSFRLLLLLVIYCYLYYYLFINIYALYIYSISLVGIPRVLLLLSFCFRAVCLHPPLLQSPLSLWPPTALHNGLSLHSPMGLFLPCTPAVHDGFVTGLSRWTDHLAMGASWYL
ncbi:hypothetical protein C0J52_24940 [Blattella germanica]|nr:hypothetical protein C0J52_24940 [Blattella germanica]